MCTYNTIESWTQQIQVDLTNLFRCYLESHSVSILYFNIFVYLLYSLTADYIYPIPSYANYIRLLFNIITNSILTLLSNQMLSFFIACQPIKGYFMLGNHIHCTFIFTFCVVISLVLCTHMIPSIPI